MNRKGFTLVELMAVITVMALFTLAIVPSILKQVSNEKDNINEVTLNLIYEAVDTYIKPRYHTYKKIAGNTYCVSLETLVNNKILDKNLINYETGSTIPLTREIQVKVNAYQEFDYKLLDENTTCASDSIIGKYVAYTPDNATWDAARDGVSTTTATSQGKFDIYDVKTKKAVPGASKNNSITCYNGSYVSKYSGWRILNIDNNGVITLIHGGTPECYYHASGQAANSVGILKTESTASNVGTNKAWTKYGNSTYATSVRYMNETDFDTIYGLSESYNNNCYGKSNCTSDELLNINSYYYLAFQYDTNSLYDWNPSASDTSSSNNLSLGVRPVVTLKANVSLGSGAGTSADPYKLVS